MIQTVQKITTVGALKELLKDIPDDTEISIENTGSTGFIQNVNLELQKFENAEIDVYLNISAESGYH